MSKNCYSSCTVIWICQNVRACCMCELIIYAEQKTAIPNPNTPPPSSRPCCKIVFMDPTISVSTRSKSTLLSRRVPTICLWTYLMEIHQMRQRRKLTHAISKNVVGQTLGTDPADPSGPFRDNTVLK